MKICFILEHFYPHIGGAETLFKEYVERLVKLGCSVKVITSSSGGLKGKVIKNGVEIYYNPWISLFGHAIPNLTNYYKIIKSADIIHTSTYTASLVALAVAKKHTKPCIITVYEALGKKWFLLENSFLKSILFYICEKFVINDNYTIFHAISSSTKKDLINLGIDPKKIVVIYPGISERFKKLIEPNFNQSHVLNDSTFFLFYGRPGKTKGINILLQSIKTLDSTLPVNILFLLVLSDDPYYEKMKFKNIITSSKLSKRVIIMDSVTNEELINLITRSYCVIIPSITEGFGLSAVEACDIGKPVIVSDAGSLPEVVFGDVLFFKNKDYKDLADKILLSLKGKFIQIPKKNFNWDLSVKKLFNIYNKLLIK